MQKLINKHKWKPYLSSAVGLESSSLSLLLLEMLGLGLELLLLLLDLLARLATVGWTVGGPVLGNWLGRASVLVGGAAFESGLMSLSLSLLLSLLLLSEPGLA